MLGEINVNLYSFDFQKHNTLGAWQGFLPINCTPTIMTTHK